MTDADNIVCCRDLLLNETVVNNHIFSATAKKLRKFKGCHDSACENGRSPSSIVVPFAVDTLGNFCSVAVIFLKKLAKIKFEKIPGSTEFRDLTASTWVNTTCRDIQTAIIKTCAYNNRSALKLAFGEEYNINYTKGQFIHLLHTMKIFHQQKVKVIDVPLFDTSFFKMY